MSLASGDPRHGTANGYNNLGCRCAECRAAIREYNRAHNTGSYKRDLCECGGSKLVRADRCQACEHAAREAPHGTEGRARRCRCDDCLDAQTEARRSRRHATRAPCSHGCGTMVDTQGRRNPDKPLECRSCAMRRINAERRAARAAA